MATRIPSTVETGARPGPGRRLAEISRSRLARQNLVLFFGGLVAGVGSFVYHAIAGRILGPVVYGQVASLIAAYAVGATLAVIISVVVARYTAALAISSLNSVTVLPRAIRLVLIPSVLGLLATALVARSFAEFEHLASATPVLILGLSLATGWQVAIPRGVFQGLQRFKALALNLALEPIVRTCALFALLAAGYAVTGAITAVFVGLAFALLFGLYSVRDQFGLPSAREQLGKAVGFSLTVAAGVIGVQLLFNQDVVLAEHYLNGHAGGIYAGLNKIGTIIYYLTLSVSQVLLPRVVESVATRQRPGRILLNSVGILMGLGAVALVVFAVVPNLVVGALYGPGFRDATPYVLVVGIIGMALSLNNLLVQFCIAVRDWAFIPILTLGCVGEATLIVAFHATVAQILSDVLGSLSALLLVLVARSYLLVGAQTVAGMARRAE